MNDNYISKLISVFLGLSILISSSIFVFSELFFVGEEQKNLKETNIQGDETELTGKNAFVESPAILPNYYSTISLNDEFKPTGNLTDDFVIYTSREIVRTNPDGPQFDELGNKSIAVLNPDILTDNFVKEFENKKIVLGNIEEEINKLVNQLKIDNSSKEDQTSYYLNELVEYLNSYLELEKALNFGMTDQSQISIISDIGYQKSSELVEKLSKMSVPSIFKNFHENLLAVLIYQKNFFKDGQKLVIDPLYVAYRIRTNQLGYMERIKNFEDETNKIIAINAEIFNSLSQKNIFEVIFGIERAHGFFAGLVKDLWALAQRAAKFARDHWQWIKDKLEKIALETLKDQLIHRLVQQVIKWVQGGGKPQFVTDWKGFLGDAVSRGIGQTLYEISPRICEPFRPLIQIAFQPVNIHEEYAACTLGDIVRNLENFYNDFKYGGWISYGSILRPEGNFYGSLIIARDVALIRASEEKESEKSDVESSRGFLSMKTCVKWTNSDVMKKELADQYAKKGDKKICGPAKFKGQELPDGYCIIQVCDRYENRTPGEVIGFSVSQAIGNSPIARIVNAQDIAALVSALVNSALMKLMKSATGLLRLNPKDIGKEDGGKGSIDDIEDACFGLEPGTEEYNDCRGITGSNIYNRIDTTEQQVSLIQTARETLNLLSEALNASNQWLITASSVQSGLETIGGCDSGTPFCQNLSAEACSLKDEIENQKSKVKNNITLLQSSIDDVKNIINELDTQQLPVDRIREISNTLNRFNDVSINKPIEALANLQQLESAVNENISGAQQCSSPLPSL